MSKRYEVAIIGAGPYGLSLAAHLRKRGVDFCIFGKPMSTWRTQMPAGMCLKSEGFASDLYDPDGELTLEKYCKANGIEYAHTGIPVKLETFSAYGVAFQKKFVPQLNETLVKDVVQDGSGFRVVLEDGKRVFARSVVVAAGITHYQYLPPVLSALSPDYVSHSARSYDLSHFKGKDVLVLGAGASAIDVAISLHESGARAQIVARSEEIPFHGRTPDKRPLTARLRAPWSGLGPGWRARLVCEFPVAFHSLPRDYRERFMKKYFGPAPGWFTKDKILKHVGLHLGMTVVAADTDDGKVRLQISGSEGKTRELTADHVIAATGYRVNLERLGFLGEAIRSGIAVDKDFPVVSKKFESSVPGLYFIGASAASNFGPLLRFAFGAGFTSRWLSRHLAAKARVASRVKEQEHIALAADYRSDGMAAQ